MLLRRIQAGEVALEVAESGGPELRPILLVHGFTGAKEDFTDCLDGLAELGWHAVAPDLRGHGGSDHPRGQEHYSFELFAADLLALADALGWARFVLLGHSMGGMVAQHVVLSHPERVAGLVLMDTSHGPPEGVDGSLLGAATDALDEGGMARLCQLQKEVGEPLSTPAHERLVAERPGYAEFGDRKFLDSAEDMWRSMAPTMLGQPDRLGRLRALSVPTLVLVGEQDDIFLGSSRRIAEAIPDARLVVIADAGHSPQFEATDAWWGALAPFLADLAAHVPVSRELTV